MRPQERDQRSEHPRHQEALAGADEKAAAAFHRLGEAAGHPLVQEPADELGGDLRDEEERDGHCRRGHGDGKAEILRERVAEALRQEAGEHDAAHESDQAEDLPEEAAERAPDAEGEDEDQTEQVERVHRMLISFLMSLPASSRFALKLGLLGS